MSMSGEALDNAVHNLYIQTIGNENQFANWTLYAIERYINTGRASAAWCAAFCKANPKKLIAHMLKGDLSDDEMLRRCTSYLKRYAGYKEG